MDTPLSGYTNDSEPKVSIWGKLKGLDPDFSREQIKELKEFIDESGVLGSNLKMRLGSQNKKDSYSVDEIMDSLEDNLSYISEFKGVLLFYGREDAKILDSDLSVDEFKIQWAKYTLKERFNLDLKDDDAKNAISILNELKQKDNPSQPKEQPKDDKFKPMQVVRKSKTYKDEATSEIKKLYELIQREFNQGKNTFEILKKLAENKIDKLV